MKFYYNVPTQVKFKMSEDVCDDTRWVGGVAYCDEVICMECGAVVECNDIAEIVELPWVSVSEEIMGED
jgi:hypothetical protein